MLKNASVALLMGQLIAAAAAAELGPSKQVDEPVIESGASRQVTSDGALETNAVPSWCALDRFSFQAGVGFITGSTVGEIGTWQSELAEGDSEGEIHLFQVSYKLTKWNPALFGRRVAVDVELPLVLGVVDERGSSPFMQYSGGFALRWKTFPWNRWLYTNLETGVGLTYSQHVLATERERHPDRERSHLEIYWPVQLMLACPRRPDHQFVFFLHHHSGGGIFHRGGANTLGLGYRFVPGEHAQ